MGFLNKKKNLSLIIVVFLFFSIVQLSDATAEDLVAEQVLPFLRDVAKIDLANYNVTLLHTFDTDLGGFKETCGIYKLESKTDDIEVAFALNNNTLVYCKVYVNQGTLKVSQPAANIADAATEFLESYHEWSENTVIEAMKTALDTVDLTKNMTVTVDDVQLDVEQTRGIVTTLNWRIVINGAKYTGLSVAFDDGVFYAFKDDRSYYHIGDTTVNVSRSEAIAIAMKQVQNFSYIYNNETVDNFTIREDKISALLLTMDRYEPSVWYPYWSVNLPLNDLYPGYVSSLAVKIWADNAEVFDCQVLGFDAMISENPTPAPAVTESPIVESPYSESEQPQNSPSASVVSESSLVVSPVVGESEAENTSLLPYIAILGVVTVVALAVMVVWIKKKHS